jgi:hypothetical protein
MRDYMWGKLKDFLLVGAIDSDPHLEIDLSGPGYALDSRIRVKLESKKDMKKRGLDSTDDGDALALTFARPVAPKKAQASEGPRSSSTVRGDGGWMNG